MRWSRFGSATEGWEQPANDGAGGVRLGLRVCFGERQQFGRLGAQVKVYAMAVRHAR